MALKVRDNIIDNIGKVPYLSILDTAEVPSTMKDAFMHAHLTFPSGGTCLEFGVGSGNSWMWQVLQILNRYRNDILIGFDSWQGLPEETTGVWTPNRHSKNAFASPRENVVQRMHEIGASVGLQFKLVDGFFSESLTNKLRSNIKNPIFVNVDCDIHNSTKEVLWWIRPLLSPGTVFYFDDWLDPNDIGKGAAKWGEHLAFEEWSRENPSVKVELIAINDVNQRAFQITSV